MINVRPRYRSDVPDSSRCARSHFISNLKSKISNTTDIPSSLPAARLRQQFPITKDPMRSTGIFCVQSHSSEFSTRRRLPRCRSYCACLVCDVTRTGRSKRNREYYAIIIEIFAYRKLGLRLSKIGMKPLIPIHFRMLCSHDHTLAFLRPFSFLHELRPAGLFWDINDHDDRVICPHHFSFNILMWSWGMR